MTEATQANNKPTFSIEKIYTKDISLEIPHAPQIFLVRENPQMEVQLHSKAISIEDGVYEVVVTATVTTKLGEKVMFLIEARQAGVFQIRNMPVEEVEPVLAVTCPNILFPYLREVISDVSVRAGFTPVLLNPVDFESIYHQQKQQSQVEAPL